MLKTIKLVVFEVIIIKNIIKQNIHILNIICFILDELNI